MMNNPLKKAASILVECGYAKPSMSEDLRHTHIRVKDAEHQSRSGYRGESVDPFSDTLEGRRQADAIEQYLYTSKYKLWTNSFKWIEGVYETQHQWRLDRIRWCLEQLGEADE